MNVSGGNVWRTIAYGMFKKRSTRSIGWKKPVSWEKAKPIRPKGASNKALDP